MTDEIGPALSAEEWAEARAQAESDWSIEARVRYAVDEADLRGPEQLLALANAALPDSDPRKITREKIRLLRIVLEAWDGCGQDPDAVRDWINAPDGRDEPPLEYFGDAAGADDIGAFLDALASYLPPAD